MSIWAFAEIVYHEWLDGQLREVLCHICFATFILKLRRSHRKAGGRIRPSSKSVKLSQAALKDPQFLLQLVTSLDGAVIFGSKAVDLLILEIPDNFG